MVNAFRAVTLHLHLRTIFVFVYKTGMSLLITKHTEYVRYMIQTRTSVDRKLTVLTLRRSMRYLSTAARVEWIAVEPSRHFPLADSTSDTQRHVLQQLAALITTVIIHIITIIILKCTEWCYHENAAGPLCTIRQKPNRSHVGIKINPRFVR